MFTFIFASTIVFLMVTQHTFQTQATEQQRQTRANLVYSRMALTITSSDYVSNAVIDWTDNLYSDFITGTTTNTSVLGIGSITLTGPSYNTNGIYTSKSLDTGFTANYTIIAWTSITPAGTTLSFQVRAADSIAALNAAAFSGPDGSTDDYYTISGATLNETVNENQYIQYRAYLSTTDNAKTPELQEVTIGVQRITTAILVNVMNAGAEPLVPNQTDVYVGAERILRSNAKRTLVLDDVTNQAFWDPGETIELSVFDVTAPTIIKVTNSAAAASTTVSP